MTQTRLAYDYVRFSSRKQRKGTSIERQESGFPGFCRQHQLTAADQYTDAGKSAFHGAHRQGGFGRFLADVESGNIPPGSVLVVEALDRFSRQAPDLALADCRAIMSAGIGIGVVLIGRIFTLADLSGEGFITLSNFFYMAHAESKRKSQMSAAAWALRRHEQKQHSPPLWLDADHNVIPERKKAIETLAELALSKGLNQLLAYAQEHIPPFNGKSWPRSYLGTLLRDRRLIGAKSPSDVDRKIVGEEVTDYYPAVLDDNTFAKLQAALDSRKGKGGRNSDNVTNLFTGLLFGSDGAKLHIRSKRLNYLVSFAAINKLPGANNKTCRYDRFEEAILTFLGEITPADLYPAGNTATLVSTLEADLAKVEVKITEITKQIENDDELAPMLFGSLKTLNNKRKTLAEALSKAKAANPPDVALADCLELIKGMAAAKDKVDYRLRLRQAIKNLIDRIDVVISDETVATIKFKSGRKREIWVHRMHARGGSPAMDRLVKTPAIRVQRKNGKLVVEELKKAN